ncbi:MAG: CRTAC1 family protein, partial [Planctomycetota bacterium]
SLASFLLKALTAATTTLLRALLLLDRGETSAVDDLLQQLPATAQHHPGIWFLRGRRAQEAGDTPGAIRCYWEVLKRHPNHDRSTYQLSQLLSSEGRSNDARVFLERAGRLTRLINTSIRLYEDRRAEAEIEECMKLTKELGRWRECRAWCEYLLEINPNHQQGAEYLNEIEGSWRDDMPWVLPEDDLARRFDLSSYALPRSPSVEQLHVEDRSAHSRAEISFADDADRLRLNFQYFNGDDPSSDGKRMFEYTGGGVAVLDYDLDGWCDLYFTQGCTWPPETSHKEHLDVIYRNVGGEQMMDVTAQVGISDSSFGQGVAAGDYNNDGFVDLYVANIDGNRLQKNNGDGTFTDVTDAVGLKRHPYWTTSCLLADIDGDSLPDLYDVTFLEGDDIFTRICLGSDGIARSCAPAGFSAAPDRIHLNAGDGTFVDASEGRGFEAPDGDGLGIVAADFDQSGDISLFIGNDGRANFFFVPRLKDAGRITSWEEIGVLSGLAYDDTGNARASMGIAAGDANGDGRLDLFVTDFYHESNMLYLNVGSRMFSDRARSTGLGEPSWEQLGFGTQFLDADLDGWEDLIVTNGHVDDFSHKQIPYKMNPQFFANHKGRFVEKFAAEAGSFFGSPKLGRGLAKMDWNRDGLTDVVISHIGDPAAVLTNRTRGANGGLGIRLVGTTRSRDAIGTRVIARTKQGVIERQLTAGDGYQASNERRLEFGLGDNETVDVEIRWPGGRVETYSDVPNKRDYLAVEGRSKLYELHAD